MAVKFPLIERGPITEIYVDGAYRMDDLGSVFHKHYFQYARDPLVNDGLPFRVPVLRMIWTREHFLLNAGNGLRWLRDRSGELDHGQIVPFRVARDLM